MQYGSHAPKSGASLQTASAVLAEANILLDIQGGALMDVLGKFSTQIPESISSNACLTRRYSVSRVLNANYLKWTQESVY